MVMEIEIKKKVSVRKRNMGNKQSYGVFKG